MRQNEFKFTQRHQQQKRSISNNHTNCNQQIGQQNLSQFDTSEIHNKMRIQSQKKERNPIQYNNFQQSNIKIQNILEDQLAQSLNQDSSCYQNKQQNLKFRMVNTMEKQIDQESIKLWIQNELTNIQKENYKKLEELILKLQINGKNYLKVNNLTEVLVNQSKSQNLTQEHLKLFEEQIQQKLQKQCEIQEQNIKEFITKIEHIQQQNQQYSKLQQFQEDFQQKLSNKVDIQQMEEQIQSLEKQFKKYQKTVESQINTFQTQYNQQFQTISDKIKDLTQTNISILQKKYTDLNQEIGMIKQQQLDQQSNLQEYYRQLEQNIKQYDQLSHNFKQFEQVINRLDSINQQVQQIESKIQILPRYQLLDDKIEQITKYNYIQNNMIQQNIQRLDQIIQNEQFNVNIIKGQISSILQANQPNLLKAKIHLKQEVNTQQQINQTEQLTPIVNNPNIGVNDEN